ncbi:glycerate kinase [uncultured Vagococcus sp.]|uniref:glycerate kinase family protein n=1 Tax=uncultured Vagococcus sp. TaxID=189676 RepID=UPI0028D65CFA|nr:glycerate kinase [uncultured Vagococcus sp.]
MKIGIAMDSFKGSVTSLEAGLAVERGIKALVPKAEVELCQVSDGGEGSLEAIYDYCGGSWQKVQTVNLMFEPIDVEYLICTIQAEKTAVIESARVIGLHFIQPSEATVSQSSSYGLGEVIKDALTKGVSKIIVTLGGSGTTDGGLGMLQSLGASIYNDQQELMGILGNPLNTFDTLDMRSVFEYYQQSGIQLEIANDVANVYAGANGAAYVFGPQKGATAAQCQWLDQQLSKVALAALEAGIDLQKVPGSGAAGGLGGAFSLLGAQMTSGFELMAGVLNLRDRLKGVSVIYTGEGSLDSQSAAGKVPSGMAGIANQSGIPIIALGGRREPFLGTLEERLTAAFSIQLEPQSLAQALNKETTLLGIETVANQSFKLLQTTLS